MCSETLELLEDIVSHEDDLTEKAKSHFGYHSEILHAFERYRRNILANTRFTRLGRHLLLTEIMNLHNDCKRILNYAAENIALLSNRPPVVRPLVIYGLPRSGTTLLYNLLACDPNCRVPLLTDMVGECIPPIARSNLVEQNRRLAALQLAKQQMEKRTGQSDEMSAAHPTFAIEEDYWLLRQTSIYILMTQLAVDVESENDTWLEELTNKDFAYDYHETFLCLLNSVDTPNSHWLWKGPIHSLYFDTFLRHYPTAKLLTVHRHLDEVLRSFCRMQLTRVKTFFDETDLVSRNRLIQRCVQFFDKMVERIMEFRTRPLVKSELSNRNLFDVTYMDLMQEPIETIRCIYHYYDLAWSNEFEMAMRSWLQENPQGKQGRHNYSLKDFGFTREGIETRYADYLNLFLRSSMTEPTKTIN